MTHMWFRFSYNDTNVGYGCGRGLRACCGSDLCLEDHYDDGYDLGLCRQGRVCRGPGASIKTETSSILSQVDWLAFAHPEQ